MDRQVARIVRAYDATVDDFERGVGETACLPRAFVDSPEYRRFINAGHTCHSGEPVIQDYLSPSPGDTFLDIGCCANIPRHRLDRWPSVYYGVDISARLLAVVQEFVRRHAIRIGGLSVAEAASLPFRDARFEIASAIGVLEYYDLNYVERALAEVHRVLRPGGRFVVDWPNQDHPDCETMIRLEGYLGRPRGPLPSRPAIENALRQRFEVDRLDTSALMVKYFVRKRPPQ